MSQPEQQGFWHHCCHHDPAACVAGQLADIRAQLGRMDEKLGTIINDEENAMSGLTDLNTNIAALQAEWTQFLTDLNNALANEDSDAAVEAASQLVAQQTAAIAAEDAIVNPPAATPPAS
jgi:hypothetical protein